MLDTDTCSYALRGHPGVKVHLMSHRLAELTISVVTEAELRFGAVKSGRHRHLDAVERWLQCLQILELASTEAEAYAGLRNELERSGQVIGDLDMLIAAHALANDLVLVTNNEREFRRVPGLKVENWASP
jgi:tRNA(fMet)-specific endonuclease VapC